MMMTIIVECIAQMGHRHQIEMSVVVMMMMITIVTMSYATMIAQQVEVQYYNQQNNISIHSAR